LVVAADISRVKLHIDGGDFCLVPRDGAQCGYGAKCVFALQCDLVEKQARNLGDDIKDLWRMDSNGLLISHASGLCLSSASNGLYSSCTPEDGWRLSNGKLESIQQQLCLSSHQSYNATLGGYELNLKTCNEQQGTWRMEPSSVVVYPIPDQSFAPYASPKYNVSVTDSGGRTYECFVYYSEALGTDPLAGQSVSYVTFSFKDYVKVTVKKLQGNFKSAWLRPRTQAQHVISKTSHNEASFTLTSPNVKLSVEFDKDWMIDSLLIFADPLETNISPVHGSNVVYYGVGRHDINLELTSNKQVYVAGGAFLFAKDPSKPIFYTSSDASQSHISIRGRGVVSGKLSSAGTYLVTTCGSYHEVEGITILDAQSQSHLQINAPWYCSTGWSGSAVGALIDNVKVFGFQFADGIYSGKRSHVRHIFTKVNDDGVKPFEGDSLYEDLTIWQQQNGWAIMMAWLTEGIQSNITVRNAAVIHDGHILDYAPEGCDPCYPNQASIGFVHGGSGTVKDVRLENIHLEDKVWRPLWFGIDKNKWADDGTGKLESWTIQNVFVSNGAYKSSQIVGTKTEAQMNGVNFEYFRRFGKVAESLKDAEIDVLGATNDILVTHPVTPSWTNTIV